MLDREGLDGLIEKIPYSQGGLGFWERIGAERLRDAILAAPESPSAPELIWEKDSENNQINTDGWTITFWEGCGDDTCHKSTWQLAYDDDDFTVERDDPEELKRIAAKIVAAQDD